jgi:hypothetical protein
MIITYLLQEAKYFEPLKMFPGDMTKQAKILSALLNRSEDNIYHHWREISKYPENFFTVENVQVVEKLLTELKDVNLLEKLNSIKNKLNIG